MAASPKLKVYSASGEYLAACHYGEDAAALVSINGEGATIRAGHSKKDIVWTEGSEAFEAGNSYDSVAKLISERIGRKIEEAHARLALRYGANA
jgi:hypothetical protein